MLNYMKTGRSIQDNTTDVDDKLCCTSSENIMIIALYTIKVLHVWGRRSASVLRRMIRFPFRFVERITSHVMNVLKAGLGEGTPQQVSDRRHKKRECGFLWHRSILALSLFSLPFPALNLPLFKIRFSLAYMINPGYYSYPHEHKFNCW